MGTLPVLLYIKIKIGLLTKRITLLSPMLVVGLKTSTIIQTQGKPKSLNTHIRQIGKESPLGRQKQHNLSCSVPSIYPRFTQR